MFFSFSEKMWHCGMSWLSWDKNIKGNSRLSTRWILLMEELVKNYLDQGGCHFCQSWEKNLQYSVPWLLASVWMWCWNRNSTLYTLYELWTLFESTVIHLVSLWVLADFARLWFRSKYPKRSSSHVQYELISFIPYIRNSLIWRKIGFAIIIYYTAVDLMFISA